MKKIAINGFGRIGRLTLRKLLKLQDVAVVAINDLTDIPTLAQLFQFDSAHRRYQGTVEYDAEHLIIDGKKIKALMLKDAAALPWRSMDIDVVLECTGINLTNESASTHLLTGARKVIISAPPKDDSIPTFVIGVNDTEINNKLQIISNASCTTNCLANVLKIIHEYYGIAFASMNTIHAFTQDQRLQDAPHNDLRRARAASVNIIPTTTGAARSVEQVYPLIEGKLIASSYRVPVITGSIIELICRVQRPGSKSEVNELFKSLSENKLKGILEYTDKPLVSSDIIGNTHSAIFDSELTEVKDDFIKVVAWYDNEGGYSSRLAEMCASFAKM